MHHCGTTSYKQDSLTLLWLFPGVSDVETRKDIFTASLLPGLFIGWKSTLQPYFSSHDLPSAWLWLPVVCLRLAAV